mgnify:CR=1 FL=1
MKMAKASKEDIDRCVKFFQLIEEFMDHGTHTPEHFEEDSIELTDEDFVQRLRELWGGSDRPLAVDSSWRRVVFGCDVLINNVCDPDADTLELRRDWADAIEPPPGLDAVLATLNGSSDTFRQMLLDKSKLLKGMCDYAERIAKRKRVEPWAIISEMTQHGSGVSSAIYELYRYSS